jgi:prevent-host-death family protein
MKTVSMLEFRRRAEAIVQQVCRGQRLILTYRGKPVARLEPIIESALAQDDPFYQLHQLADGKGKSLSNEEIDKTVYGE